MMNVNQIIGSRIDTKNWFLVPTLGKMKKYQLRRDKNNQKKIYIN